MGPFDSGGRDGALESSVVLQRLLQISSVRTLQLEIGQPTCCAMNGVCVATHLVLVMC